MCVSFRKETYISHYSILEATIANAHLILFKWYVRKALVHKQIPIITEIEGVQDFQYDALYP